ncbi:hypothetical protein SDC9_192572 [bioreactor metagenome]|uniref:Uncharacterized protein n=1 Tax=bioreactor metagenome TaxID=1076179 RepID=A0A645I151_9ZZZZ
MRLLYQTAVKEAFIDQPALIADRLFSLEPIKAPLGITAVSIISVHILLRPPIGHVFRHVEQRFFQKNHR